MGKIEIQNKLVAGILYADYDVKNHQITIENKADQPLTIKFKGQLNLSLTDDFMLESNGEVDVLTNGSMICLDSIDSVIHLNSRKCKKVRIDDSNTSVEDIQKINKQVAQRGHERHRCRMSEYQKLQQLIDNINQRLLKLENEELKTIDIKSDEGG